MGAFNEYDLVIRLQHDDVKAFDALYHKYHNAVYYNILKLTKVVDVTQDIIQEVFIALWVKRLSIDPHLSVSGWLFVVSYNKSLNYLKKTLRESVIRSNEGIKMRVSNEQEINLRETQLTLLEEAIRQLSPQKRKVFDLCKLEGKSYEETAKELDISKHTVKEYLSNAIAYIKVYIRQHPQYHSAYIGADLLAILYFT